MKAFIIAHCVFSFNEKGNKMIFQEILDTTEYLSK